MSRWVKLILFFFVILVTKMAGAVCAVSMGISENQDTDFATPYTITTQLCYGEQVQASRTEAEMALEKMLAQDDADLPVSPAFHSTVLVKDLKFTLKHLFLLLHHRMTSKEDKRIHWYPNPNPPVNNPIRYYIYTLERIMI